MRLPKLLDQGPIPLNKPKLDAPPYQPYPKEEEVGFINVEAKHAKRTTTHAGCAAFRPGSSYRASGATTLSAYN